MKPQVSSYLSRRNLHAFIACLLTLSLTIVPFVPIAAAMSSGVERRSSQKRDTRSSGATEGQRNSAGPNAPIPEPAPEPFAVVISATKTDALISDDGDLKADPGGTEKIEYTVTISNTGTTDATNVAFTDTIDAHTTLVGGSITTQPIAVNDTFSALGNVRIQVPDGANDLLNNDCDPDTLGGPCTNAGLTITTLGGDASAPFAGTSTQGGQVTATTGDGSFQYNPAPGFEGTDTFTYIVTDGTGKSDTATVTITVTGMIWFVNAASPGGGDGRLSNPFNCLVGAGCFQPVAADDPGDNIFMFSGTYNDNAALVLLNNQKLIGAAAGATLASITGVTVPTHSDPLPATGGASPVITSTASGVQLASGNLLRGFTVGNTSTSAGNYDISNTTTATVGTLNISEVLLNGNGGLLRVDSGGTLNVAFVSAATSSAGSNGFHIAGASGAVTVGAGGAISGVAGADVVINGGTVAFSLASPITHTTNTATVDIANHTTGAFIFNGPMSAFNGTGLQFNNADSSYSFNAAATLEGGDAGIDIIGGSSGTFTFAAGSTISNPSGTAFNVGGSSSPGVTYSGSITQSTSSQRVVNIDGTASNTITFNTGTITGGASSTGININNANGNVTFSNGMTLGTSGARMANQAITIAGGTGTYGLGAISVFTNGAQGLAATNADGTINATGNVNTTNTGAVANLAAIRIGGPVGLTTLGLNFTSVAANATAFGILVQDTNGSFTVTGTATGMDRCGGLVSVNAVGTPAGFSAPVAGECTGGTIQNITTSGVQATNATNLSLSRINFVSANTADGGAAGGTCDLGNVSTCNGAIDLTNVTGVTLSRINISGAEEQGVVGSTVTGFSLTNSNVQNAGDEAAENGVYFINLFGTVSVTGSRFTGSAFNNFGVLNDTAGTPLNMTVTGSIFSSNSAIGGDGLVMDTRTGTNSNVRVNTSTFTANKDDHFNFVSSITAIANVTFDDNTLTGGHASPTGQGVAIRVGGPFSGTMRFDIEGNSINGAIPTAINTGLGSSEPSGIVHGFIRNNTVGTSGVNNSGSAQGSCILAEANGLGSGGVHAAPAGTYNASITGNILRQCFDKGIDLLAVRDGDNNMNVTVSNNNVNELDDVGLSRWAIRLETGSSSADETGNVCSDILNNTLNAVVQIDEMSVRARSIATIRFPGYTSGTTDTAALVTYLQGRNPAGGTATATVSGGSTFNNTIPASTPCTQPTTPILPSGPITSDSSAFVDSNKSTEPHQTFAISSGFEKAPKLVTPRSSSVKTALESSSKARPQKSEVRSNHAVSEVSPQKPVVRSAGSTSRRQVVSNHVVARRQPLATMVVAGETLNVNIGTLRAGDSVVITFQVTVNNPPNLTGVPPGTAQVENQGSVSYAESVTPVLTDDPAVVGAADKTATPVDLFDTSTSLVSDLNPSNFGDLVTFTATISETPVQGSVDPTGTVDFIDTSNGNAVICNDVALTTGSAQCQTSALTSSTHNIRADYSGDGNFDPSQSNIVAQVVNTCTPNPIVTNTADSGAGTLREALANVCSGTTITFNIAGPGPHTITLTTGELAPAKNVTINNDSGESITVSGNNTSRVFNISGNLNVTFRGLTISGGQATGGAGILNASTGVVNVINSSVSGNISTSGAGGIINANTGTLNVINSTISGNSAATNGGGLVNSLTGTLNVINSTISGNTAAGDGGGIEDNNSGTINVVNSTITNNRADFDGNSTGAGGGISRSGATVTLHNTIVAGNFNEDGASDAADDISGTMNAASSFNLIGTGGSGGLTNGVNGNQVGVADAGLGALASNGGSTETHALLPTSPAVEAGSNANLPTDTFDLDGDANTAETLPVDQRGTGFPRVADSADANTTQTVDIGAFELHPSIEDIGNQATNEDTVKNVVFNLGDDTGSLISTVTATSSNTTLVPNANLSFSGSGGSRTLQITPAANQSGTTTITVTVTATNGRTATDTFDLTVNGLNDPPAGTDNTVNTPENTAYTFTAADFGFTDTNDTPPNTLLAVKITTLPALGTLTNNNVAVNAGDSIPVADINGGLLKFTPVAGANGTPYTSFTFQVQDNGGGTDLDPTPNTMTISVTAVNDGPVNTVPGPQSTNQNTSLTFSSGNGNQISVADVDAGGNSIQVTLTVTNGTLTLSGITGLSFSVGDGTADATMTFVGTLANVNTALNGMTFTPTLGFSGAASLTITSNDLGNTGSGGPLTDTDVVAIQVSTNISIQDAQVVEPTSGSVNMIFTVTLSAPAPAGGVLVTFTTMDEVPPSLTHATASQDYTTTSGTLSFAAGEQFKTILVPVLSDINAESNETFLVVLSGPVNGQLADGTATGTILNTSQPGTVLISELRTSGPAGAGDDFVELYNNSDSALTVTASDGSPGYGLFKMGADCSATPVLIGTIPNGTVIPARAHYLFVGSVYSLADYGGTGAAAGDQTLSSDIESDRNVAIFTTASVVNISSANRLDAVGFGTNTGGSCDLLREGTTLTPLSGTVLEHSYVRDECGKKGNPAAFGPCPSGYVPSDSNVNNDDFLFVDTSATLTPAGQRLGAPGPENLSSPTRSVNIGTALLDSGIGAPAPPNRVRDLTPAPNAANGTLSIRRRFVNNTAAPITRLRFRIVDFSSISVPVGIADLRALTSTSVSVNGINDAATCLASTGSPTTPCNVTVLGTTLETPPAQPLGGAHNSSMSAGTVTLATPLAPGASINLQFLLGVQQSGSFKFFINLEANPNSSAVPLGPTSSPSTKSTKIRVN